MKYVDTPPILAILFSKLQTPPHIRVQFKETPPNWLSFIYTPPKIGENGLHPPPKCMDILTSSLKLKILSFNQMADIFVMMKNFQD